MPLLPHIAELSGEQFRLAQPALAKIYERSFPRNEREDFAVIFDGASTHTIFGAYSANGLVGFSDLFFIGNREAIIRYLAVDEEHRSQGIGRHLLDYMVTWWEDRLDRVIFEVESPPSAPNACHAARRIRFYEQWGAHQIRTIDRYFYPDTIDVSAPVPVLLFEWHRTGACLAGDRLRDTISRLYQYCYGADAARFHLETLLGRVVC